jgi:hypothetical protein
LAPLLLAELLTDREESLNTKKKEEMSGSDKLVVYLPQKIIRIIRTDKYTK